MKLSKQAKSRLKRMSAGDKKAVAKASLMLADADVITRGRYDAIMRTLKSCTNF